MVDEKKVIKKDSDPHFVKIIDYAPEENWRTDVLIGQKGFEPHGHLSLSGASVFYLRDEAGNVIIKNGSIVNHDEEEKTLK